MCKLFSNLFLLPRLALNSWVQAVLCRDCGLAPLEIDLPRSYLSSPLSPPPLQGERGVILREAFGIKQGIHIRRMQVISRGKDSSWPILF